MRQKKEKGFTLLEMLVAMTILALVAVLSWRGLTQITRARDVIGQKMNDERSLSQFFDQVGQDLRVASTDDQASQPAVMIGNQKLRIVRVLNDEADKQNNTPPQLQLIEYRVDDQTVIREASAPLTTRQELQNALRGNLNQTSSQVKLLGNVQKLTVRAYIESVGWTDNANDMTSAMAKENQQMLNALIKNEPLQRSAAGIEITLFIKSLKQPLKKLYLIGQ